jgi:hypothetical protein
LGYRSSADNDINAAYKDIIAKLKDLNNISGIQLNIANGIFSREQLLPDYANKVTRRLTTPKVDLRDFATEGRRMLILLVTNGNSML